MRNPFIGLSKNSVVTLSVNGEKYTDFVAGSVRLSMEEIANSFEVEFLKESGGGIYCGDEVKIDINGDPLLGGYVETLTVEDSAASIRYTAGGRSKTGDLIDCTPIAGAPVSWRNTSIIEIISSLTYPFGIDVLSNTSASQADTIVPYFARSPGDKIYDIIQLLVCQYGIIPYCVDDYLMLGAVGSLKSPDPLVRGVNIIESSASTSFLDRYSHYVYVSQIKPKKTFSGKVVKEKEAFEDTAIKRLRPLVVQKEAHDSADLKTRAKFEMNRRIGSSQQVTVVVENFTSDGVFAWRPNTLVHVVNDVLGIAAELLIVSATYRFGAEAPQTVDLVLQSPEAFSYIDSHPQTPRGKVRKK